MSLFGNGVYDIYTVLRDIATHLSNQSTVLLGIAYNAADDLYTVTGKMLMTKRLFIGTEIEFADTTLQHTAFTNALKVTYDNTVSTVSTHTTGIADNVQAINNLDTAMQNTNSTFSSAIATNASDIATNASGISANTQTIADLNLSVDTFDRLYIKNSIRLIYGGLLFDTEIENPLSANCPGATFPVFAQWMSHDRIYTSQYNYYIGELYDVLEEGGTNVWALMARDLSGQDPDVLISADHLGNVAVANDLHVDGNFEIQGDINMGVNGDINMGTNTVLNLGVNSSLNFDDGSVQSSAFTSAFKSTVENLQTHNVYEGRAHITVAAPYGPAQLNPTPPPDAPTQIVYANQVLGGWYGFDSFMLDSIGTNQIYSNPNFDDIFNSQGEFNVTGVFTVSVFYDLRGDNNYITAWRGSLTTYIDDVIQAPTYYTGLKHDGNSSDWSEYGNNITKVFRIHDGIRNRIRFRFELEYGVLTGNIPEFDIIINISRIPI